MTRTSHSIEHIVQNERLSVVLAEPYGPTYAALAQRLRALNAAQVIECDTTARATMLIAQLQRAVLLIHVPKENETQAALNVILGLRTRIEARSVSVIVSLAAQGGAPEIKALRNMGASAVLNAQSDAGSIEAAVKRALHQISQPRVVTRGAVYAAVKLNPALQIESDCWLMAGGGAKKVGEVWHVKLKGPSSLVGSWEPIAGQPWRWIWRPTHLQENSFVVEKGAWVFSGECPQFDQDAWHFVGNSLGFFDGERSFGFKFESSAKGSLKIARDSNRMLGAPGISDERLTEEIVRIQPLLNPISLAFLMSAWTAQFAADRRTICEQYCLKLSDACQGVQVELWVRYGTRWSCVGSSHPDSTQDGAMARASGGVSSVREDFAWLTQEGGNEDALVVPIRTSSRLVAGALVVGGERVRELDTAYAMTAAQMAKGLILSFQEEAVRAKERAAS